ncbi:hypothetical protein GG344DRAFT_83708 [Lentinula edodes]|nr:hypothetical protein GG344DRAFT_83708 [Lentinula edodes]
MPTALLFYKLQDLDLSNIEPPQFLGTSPSGRVPSREPTTSRPNPIYGLFNSYIDVLASTTPTTDLSGPPGNPLKGHHLFAPATTRSFLSSVAVPVAPFELQPAPSTLQHKPSYTKPYLKTVKSMPRASIPPLGESTASIGKYGHLVESSPPPDSAAEALEGLNDVEKGSVDEGTSSQVGGSVPMELDLPMIESLAERTLSPEKGAEPAQTL